MCRYGDYAYTKTMRGTGLNVANARLFRLKPKRIGIPFVTLMIILAGTVVFIMNRPAINPIPQNIQAAVTFPVYYPSELPTDYQIDQNSFQANNQAVLYSIIKTGSPSIAVSVQPKPNNFDFDDFHLKKLSGSKEIITLSGKAVVGVLGGRTVGSLAADKSWVLITAPNDVPTSEIETILKSLTTVRQ